MIPPFFARRPSYRDQVYAEAQALVDDGLEVDFVLGLYADEAEWLEPLLESSELIIDATRGAEPSYYFEASLKAKFVAAGEARGREAARVPASAVRPFPVVRSVAAGSVVVALSGAAAVLALGFVTAGNAVPGDWNYRLKLAGEKVEYALATGDDRVNVDIRQGSERVYELKRLLDTGHLTEADIQRLTRDLGDIAAIAQDRPLDSVQLASARAIRDSSTELLTNVITAKPELAPAAKDAIAVAAGLGNPTVVTTVEPLPEATPAATAPATPTLTPQPSPTATGTVEPTATATPEASASTTPTGSTAPVSSATETPGGVATPTPGPTEASTPGPAN